MDSSHIFFSYDFLALLQKTCEWLLLLQTSEFADPIKSFAQFFKNTFHGIYHTRTRLRYWFPQHCHHRFFLLIHFFNKTLEIVSSWEYCWKPWNNSSFDWQNLRRTHCRAPSTKWLRDREVDNIFSSSIFITFISWILPRKWLKKGLW